MSLKSRAPATLTLTARTSVESSIDSVKDTFSSWDSCMSKAYCKWPVIVGIIIGALILLSLLSCLFKILFCGAECCFCCVGCAKCLCCGWGSGGRNKNKNNNNNNDNNDQDFQQRYKNNGYAQPPGNTAYGGYAQAAQPQYQSTAPPQYSMSTATFDAPSKKDYGGNADALPHMPSWGDAESRKIEDHTVANSDDVELGRLNPAEPMLPKFQSDDYAARRDSSHGMSDITGDLGLGAGAMAANPHRDNYASPSSPTRPQPGGYGAPTSPTRRLPVYNTPASPTRNTYSQQDYATQQGYAQQSQRNFSSPRSTQPRIQPNYTSPTGQQAQSPTYGNQPSPIYSRGAAQASSPTYAPAQDHVATHGFGVRTPSPPQNTYPSSGGYGGLGAAPQGYSVRGSGGQGGAAYPGQNSYASSPYAGQAATRKPLDGAWRDV